MGARPRHPPRRLTGDPAAADQLTEFLDRHADSPDWGALAAVLRRIHAGERDPDTLLAGLDEIDTAIAQRALAALDGTVQLAAPPGNPDAFLDVLADAARGDQQATAAVTPVLDAFAADPTTTALAAALRRLIDGERDHDQLVAGLDPHAADLVKSALDRL